MEQNRKYFTINQNKSFCYHNLSIFVGNQDKKKDLILFCSFYKKLIDNPFIAYKYSNELEIQCYLNNKEFESIAPHFVTLNELRNLKMRIENNKFQSAGASLLSQSLVHFKNLVVFNLEIDSSCSIGEDGAIALGNGLRNLESLNHFGLIIGKNEIMTKGAISLGEGLSYIKRLESLSLIIGKYNQVGEEGIKHICQGIISSRQFLQKLNLFIGWYNQINNIGGKSIANCISQLPNLQEVLITIRKDNHVESEGLNPLLQSFQNKKYLKSVFLSANELYSEEQPDVDISQLFEGLKHIEKFHLKLMFDQINLSRLSSSIHNLENLQFLSLKIIWYEINLENIQLFGIALQQLKGLKTCIVRAKLYNFEKKYISILSQFMRELNHLQYLGFLFKNYNSKLQFKSTAFYKLQRLVTCIL